MTLLILTICSYMLSTFSISVLRILIKVALDSWFDNLSTPTMFH